MTTAIEDLTPLQKLEQDIKNATETLDPRQARYLVDLYYTMQEHRIALGGQSRSMTADEEPHEAVSFFERQMGALESQAKVVLDHWSAQQPLGQWARRQKGVGPVLAAGMLAHIDVRIAVTAGHVWRFAGLDPTVEWAKGQKRPWNADLKVLCWKMGESFMKVSGRDDAFYGKLYAKRKQFEIERNGLVRRLPDAVVLDQVFGSDSFVSGCDTHMLSVDGQAVTAYRIPQPKGDVESTDAWFIGGNAQAAQEALTKKKIGRETNAYKAYVLGQIPDAQILARAKRYAVKLFLAHYIEVGRRQLGLEVPMPYPIAHMGHTDYMAPPE